MKPKILVVDDAVSHRAMLEAVLTAEGYAVFQADSGQAAVEAVEAQYFDLILMDIRMHHMDGVAALKSIKQISPGIPIVMMTAYASVETAVDALKSGAFDYLTKPLDIEELKMLIQKVLRHYQLEQENRYLRERVRDRFDFAHIIGRCAAMQKLFETIALVAPTEATVLITGESGTGKELIANAVHQNSNRRQRPFIKVNCAALPETLLESELFGHEKGAFTGAAARRKGRFQAADTGTIFLDEITEMPSALQPKLLRVLQDGEIDPLGGAQTIRLDTRIISATNRNPAEAVAEGVLREDLFYRLNVINIHVPALRERREDIPLLAEHFLRQYAESNKKLVKRISPKTMDLFMRYDWPGNVRELENTIERAVILCRGDTVTPAEVPEPIQRSEPLPDPGPPALPIGKPLKEIEREMILKTLDHKGGNRTQTAQILGISRRTLQLKLKEYGIN